MSSIYNALIEDLSKVLSKNFEESSTWTMNKKTQFRFFSQSKQKAKKRIGRKLRGLK